MDIKIYSLFVLFCVVFATHLTVPRTAVLMWDNNTVAPGTKWEYRLFEYTCHYQGNGVTKGTTDRPRIELGDVCSVQWVYVQVRAVRNKLYSEWTGDLIK